MFNFRKHDNEICFASHIGYDLKWRILMLSFNLYKYEMTINVELRHNNV
jgi:hypothetical protein